VTVPKHDAGGRPLVLGYHAVSSTWRTPLAVSEALLRSQLTYLRERGYVGLTFVDAERRRSEGTLPPRSVVVTFDDGYASTLRAVPILAELGFPGTVFVVTDFVESGEPLSWPGIDQLLRPDTIEELRPLTWEAAEELAAAGWEVGSHTMTHPLLTSVDDGRLRVELEDSRSAVERRVGPCVSLSYPYGLADARVAAAAAKAGYEAACMLTFAHFVDEPLRRPRIGMGSADTRIRLAIQVSRFGQAARRSAAARLARALHRRRRWLPDG
jgi:peptidoglycan/xylan/chitin deacetylase (PgdA/CDA1 family)